METTLSNKTALESPLHKAGDHFENGGGLDLYQFANGTVVLTFEFPEYEQTPDIICMYWKEFPNPDAAMRALEHAGVHDLGKLNRLTLHGLFLQGVIELSCHVEKGGKGHRYFFRYLDGGIFMSEEYQPGEKRVKAEVIKLLDFVTYARVVAAAADTVPV